MILVGTGSEVQSRSPPPSCWPPTGVAARVVSMPCREWFDEQDQAYRDSVFPPSVTARVSVEAGISLGWRDIVGDAGRIVSLNHYGASAAAGVLFTEFGFTAETVAAAAPESLAAATSRRRPRHHASGRQRPGRPRRRGRGSEPSAHASAARLRRGPAASTNE